MRAIFLPLLFTCQLLFAKTVVSTSPAITQILVELGVESSIIGKTLYDKEIDAEVTGSAISLNIEKVAQLRPDLVLLESTSSDKVRDDLEKINISSQSFSLRTSSEIKKTITDLGELFLKQSKAKEINQKITDQLQTNTTSKAKAVFVFSNTIKLNTVTEIFYLAEDSVHGEIFAAAGYQNLAPNVSGVPSLSIEKLLELGPEILVLLLSNDASESYIANIKEAYNKTPLLSSIPIKIVKFENPYINGPKVFELVSQL